MRAGKFRNWFKCSYIRLIFLPIPPSLLQYCPTRLHLFCVSNPFPYPRFYLLQPARELISKHFSQIYRDEDKPLYRKGNKILIGICYYNIFLFIGAKVFYAMKNRYVYIYLFFLLSPKLYISHHTHTLFLSRRLADIRAFFFLVCFLTALAKKDGMLSRPKRSRDTLRRQRIKAINGTLFSHPPPLSPPPPLHPPSKTT